MIKLFQFPRLWNLPNASPFCMKIETYLRMAKLPYQTIFMRDPRKAPKGKLPFIIDNEKTIADSGLIIKYLQQNYSNDLDKGLTSLEQAQALALQRLMEEHLYWVMVYFRWIDPVNWETTKKTFFAGLPFYLRPVLPAAIQKKTKQVLYAQGIGRHSVTEISELGIDDLAALNTLLSNHSFLLRDEPTTIDACGYAFIANLLEVPIQSPLKDYVKAHDNFSHYCAHMKELYY